MNLVTVDSSMLYAVGYDPDTQELVAVFNSGRTWWYEGVPAEVYQQLMSSDSIGGYMRDFIIDMYPDHSSYPYRRMKRSE